MHDRPGSPRSERQASLLVVIVAAFMMRNGRKREMWALCAVGGCSSDAPRSPLFT